MWSIVVNTQLPVKCLTTVPCKVFHTLSITNVAVLRKASKICLQIMKAQTASHRPSNKEKKVRKNFIKKHPCIPMVRHGGGSMLWGNFSSPAKGKLVRLCKKIYEANYIAVQDESLLCLTHTTWGTDVVQAKKSLVQSEHSHQLQSSRKLLPEVYFFLNGSCQKVRFWPERCIQYISK